MSSNSNRPKPAASTGQQKATGAVEPKLTSTADISSDNKAADLVAANMDEITSGARKVDIFTHQEALSELNEARKELEFVKGQLNDIRLILSNPFHQVGYLVNADPIQRIVDRKYAGV